MSLDLHARQISNHHTRSKELEARKESGFYDEVFVRFGNEIRHYRYYSQWEQWMQLPLVSNKAVSAPLVAWHQNHVVSGTAVVVAEDIDGSRGIRTYYRDWLGTQPWQSSSLTTWRIGENLSGVLTLGLTLENGRSKISRSTAFLFAWDYHHQQIACLRLDGFDTDSDGSIKVRWLGPKPIGPSIEDTFGDPTYYGEVVSAPLPWSGNHRILLKRGAGLMQCTGAHISLDALVADMSPVGIVKEPAVAPPAMVAVPASRRLEIVVPHASGLTHYVQEDGRSDWQAGTKIPCTLAARPHLILHPYLKQICMVVREGSELRSFTYDWESRKEWREGPSIGRQVVGEPALYLKQDYRDGTLYPVAVVREATDSIQFYRYDMRHGHWSSTLF